MEGTLFIGLDAGGSKTAVVAATDADPITFTGEFGAANLQRAGRDAAAAVLASAIRAAFDQHSHITAVWACAGVSGAGRASEAADLAEEVSRHTQMGPPCHVAVLHDGVIAVEGAFAGKSGAVIIAGTGSIVLALDDNGTLHRAGGWGYLIGDEGSGYALGAAGARAVAEELDGGAATALTAGVSHQLQIDSRDALIEAVYRGRVPLQQLAPLVLSAAASGDAVCAELAWGEACALADRLVLLAARMRDAASRVALTGGLVRDPYYRAALTRAIRERLPAWEVTEPMESPVHGALRLARQFSQGRLPTGG